MATWVDSQNKNINHKVTSPFQSQISDPRWTSEPPPKSHPKANVYWLAESNRSTASRILKSILELVFFVCGHLGWCSNLLVPTLWYSLHWLFNVIPSLTVWTYHFVAVKDGKLVTRKRMYIRPQLFMSAWSKHPHMNDKTTRLLTLPSNARPPMRRLKRA